MANSRFTITKFTNPSGVEIFRLSGTLHGERIRKNFKKREEAVAERQQLDIRYLNDSSEGQTIWTTLTHGQNEDAIATVNILKKAGLSKSLTFAANYLVEHYHEAAETKSLEDAVDEYVDSKSGELDRKIIIRSATLSVLGKGIE